MNNSSNSSNNLNCEPNERKSIRQLPQNTGRITKLGQKGKVLPKV